MRIEDKLPENLREVLSKGVLKRLPLTFLPFVHQQLNQWDHLFPNERQSVQRLLLYVASLTPEQSAGLFREVVTLEEKMGVSHWEFSTTEQTIQNSSLLARSAYFQDWRRAVQAVYDAAEGDALKNSAAGTRHRLVLLEIPPALPVDATTVWRRWQGIGRTVQLDLGSSSQKHSALERLLTGTPDAASLLDLARRPDAAPAESWVIDAGRSLVDTVLERQAAGSAILLSNGRLDNYRQSFSREMNTMHKNLTDADAVFDHLRKVDVAPWCPEEVAAEPAVREFLRSLYLTGNGAVIYGNSFVEWAASEAFRRARPCLLAAQFGVRSKPKPFTGVAVFDNPDQVNPLPAVDDLPGSAVDAQILALYVWLAAIRCPEYQNAVCVCIAESLSQAYLVAPPELGLDQKTEPVMLEQLAHQLRAWMAV
jgi:hypothetical protein